MRARPAPTVRGCEQSLGLELRAGTVRHWMRGRTVVGGFGWLELGLGVGSGCDSAVVLVQALVAGSAERGEVGYFGEAAVLVVVDVVAFGVL